MGFFFRDSSDEFTEEIIDSMQNQSDAIIEKYFDLHANAKSTLERFKKALIDASNEVQVIIIIDELDRCNPSYALNFLEVIKHTFDVSETVSFIISANLNQLNKTVRSTYGDIDSEIYLDKFFTYQIDLVGVLKNNIYKEASIQYFDSEIKKINGFESSYLVRDEKVVRYIHDLIRHFKFSLRQINKLIIYLNLYNKITEGKLFEVTHRSVSKIRVKIKILCVFFLLHERSKLFYHLDDNTLPSSLLNFDKDELPKNTNDHIDGFLYMRFLLGYLTYPSYDEIPQHFSQIISWAAKEIYSMEDFKREFMNTAKTLFLMT